MKDNYYFFISKKSSDAMDFDASSHTSGDTSSDDTDDASYDLSSGSDMSFLEDLCILSLVLSSRANRLVVARMSWHHHTQILVHESACLMNPLISYWNYCLPNCI
jgi:hypothetical protein